MTRLGRATDEAVDELSARRVFAAATVGDGHVTTCLAHLDRLGAVYPIRTRSERMDVAPGSVPSASELGRALAASWDGLGADASFEYHRFFLCLPPWGALSREAASRINVSPGDQGQAAMQVPSVTARDVARLETQLCRQQAMPGFVICDLARHAYCGDSDLPMKDPIGARTRSLRVRGHVVFSDLNSTTVILESLRSLGVRVDVMVSAFTSVSPNLTLPEKSRGCAAVDVDRANTHLSFYRDEQLAHTRLVSSGSRAVLIDSAHTLKTRPEELSWLWNAEDPVRLHDISLGRPGRLPQRSLQGGTQSLDDWNSAADMAVASLFERIRREVEETRLELGWRPNSLLFVGEDSVTIPRLVNAARACGYEAEWRIPERVHGNGRFAVPGAARLVGMIRACAFARSPAPCQPFLDAYNESLIDGLSNRVRQAFHDVVRRAAGNVSAFMRRGEPGEGAGGIAAALF